MPKKTNLLEDPHGFSISLVLNGLLVGLAAGDSVIVYRVG